MRRPLKITSRSSTITNAFVQAILPRVQLDPDERAAVLAHFGQSGPDMVCVYCGDWASDWDHLSPLVAGKRPSGCTSGLGNMVPACARCNQSKSGHPWHVWMRGNAMHSPTRRGVPDLEERFEALEAFERAFPHECFDFKAAVAPELWEEYWRKHDVIQEALADAQKLADRIKASHPAEGRSGAAP